MAEAAVIPLQDLSACNIPACECSRFVPAWRSISVANHISAGTLFLSLRGIAFAKGELLCGIQQKVQLFCVLSLQSASDEVLSDNSLLDWHC